MRKDPKSVSMTYRRMREYFRAAESKRQHLTGYIVFSSASFEKEYSLESRTYVVSSDNKAFQPGCPAVRPQGEQVCDIPASIAFCPQKAA